MEKPKMVTKPNIALNQSKMLEKVNHFREIHHFKRIKKIWKIISQGNLVFYFGFSVEST
jgi:hypothetical protein